MNGTRTGTASGKVILLGEHAVVYGVPALAVGIDRGARATATPVASGPSRLRVRGWEVDVTEDDAGNDLGRAFGALVRAVRAEASGPAHVHVVAEADLPPGGGLGCSAAIGVAVARAISYDPPAEQLSSFVNAWEQVFHGNPSGVDAAVCARGGCVVFQKQEGHAHLEPVAVKGGLTLCIGNSGIASSTKSMVESVARLAERRPSVVGKAWEGIGALVRNARLAIEAGDRFALGRLMDLNQMLLSGLFLSTPEIETMCEAARGASALGAKLTGAGGGGSVVALVNGMAGAERVLAAWEKEGFTGFATRVAAAEDAELPRTHAPTQAHAQAQAHAHAIGGGPS
jgi:mevalonate kinase